MGTTHEPVRQQSRSDHVLVTPIDDFKELSQRIRASDQAAYQKVFELSYGGLHRYAEGILGETESAKDVVQEVFLRVWRRREALDPERSLRALLYRAVRNLAFNQKRTATGRQMMLATIDVAQHTPDASEEVEAGILGERIREWIREMPQKRREAFQLSRFDGLSYQEIGRVMNLSVRTVERHIQLALRHLRDRLKEYEPDLLRP